MAGNRKVIVSSQEIQDEVVRQTQCLVEGFGDRMDVSALWSALDDASFKYLRSELRRDCNAVCRHLLAANGSASRRQICQDTPSIVLVFVLDRAKAALECVKAMNRQYPCGVSALRDLWLERFVTDCVICQEHQRGESIHAP